MNSHQNVFLKVINSRLLHHFLFWSFFFAFLSVSPEVRGVPFIKLLIHNLGHIAVLIPPVYIHFFILEKFFLNRRFGIYTGLFLVLWVVFSFVANFVFEKYFDYKGGLFAALYFVGFAIVISTAAKLIKKAVRQRLQIQEAESKQLQTELELLKAQINPHFLFNTLNNLFGMARNQDAATAEGISRLSHLMRYMIHDSQVEWIDLNKEIDQVRRLIELQKLRFSHDDDIHIDFLVVGQTERIQIPPMILIPFVENAFKHGISLDEASFVQIVLKAQENRLEFSIKNSVHAPRTEYKESEAGLGLSNVRRRLELLYPGEHELNIQDSDKVFEVSLIIELKQ
jgi:sensor histidine kinase YesM